jgi:hypothetical protein
LEQEEYHSRKVDAYEVGDKKKQGAPGQMEKP